MKKIITITTDFRDQFAAGQVKAVIERLGFEGSVIENHDVSSFSVIEGAYGIWQLSKYCSPETVHLGVVDPGVGSKRKGIVVQTTNFWLVGPDNGLLWPTAERDGIQRVWKVDEKKFGEVAGTFHGRDVFVKVAVWLSQAKNPEEFGCKLLKKDELVKLSFREGQILHIDAYGNAKFYRRNKVQPGEFLFGIPVVNTFSDVPKGRALILNGSSDLPELAINLGNAKERFGLELGQVLEKLDE